MCSLRPLLKMSSTARDETSRGRNPENGRRRDFGRSRRHRQSGFQHTDRPRPSSPELFNKDHNAGRESLSHLIILHSLSYLMFVVCSSNSDCVSTQFIDALFLLHSSRYISSNAYVCSCVHD